MLPRSGYGRPSRLAQNTKYELRHCGIFLPWFELRCTSPAQILPDVGTKSARTEEELAARHRVNDLLSSRTTETSNPGRYPSQAVLDSLQRLLDGLVIRSYTCVQICNCYAATSMLVVGNLGGKLVGVCGSKYCRS